MAAIKVPGYTGKMGSHMWRNRKFIKAFSWLDTSEFSKVSATSGAENLAPPGDGKSPITAGITTLVNL